MMYSESNMNIELDIWIPEYNLALEYHGKKNLLIKNSYFN